MTFLRGGRVWVRAAWSLVITVLWLCWVSDPGYSNIWTGSCYGWPLSLTPGLGSQAAPDILISDAANILSMWGTSLQMLPPDLAQVSVWLNVAWTESQDLGYPHLRLVDTETVKNRSLTEPRRYTLMAGIWWASNGDCAWNYLALIHSDLIKTNSS